MVAEILFIANRALHLVPMCNPDLKRVAIGSWPGRPNFLSAVSDLESAKQSLDPVATLANEKPWQTDAAQIMGVEYGA